MILTDKTIIDEITEGNIVIEPFNPKTHPCIAFAHFPHSTSLPRQSSVFSAKYSYICPAKFDDSSIKSTLITFKTFYHGIRY